MNSPKALPGTLLPGPRSVTLVGWLNHAGVDGVLDADEEQILAETIAHEVGHYVGLFHPVESDYDSWDAIPDTVECKEFYTCEQQLGKILMYPYPVCFFDGTSKLQLLMAICYESLNKSGNAAAKFVARVHPKRLRYI